MKINHNTKKINYNLSSISSTHGFSLVELMVVVAIIGILASVAVPQFEKFQARARQSEAKTLLATLYTAESSFQIEWSGYSSSFTAIGFEPTGEIRYALGFKTGDNYCALNYYSAGAGVCEGTSGTDYSVNTVEACSVSGAKCKLLAGAKGSAATADDLTGTVDATKYTAQAYAYITKTGSADFWEINQDKNLKNTTSGL